MQIYTLEDIIFLAFPNSVHYFTGGVNAERVDGIKTAVLSEYSTSVNIASETKIVTYNSKYI